MLSDCKIVIFHNIVNPYKTLLFNELCKLCDKVQVLYMSEAESDRPWEIDWNELEFSYKVLFKGRLDNISKLTLLRKTWKNLDSLNPDVLILGGYQYSAYWAALFWAKLNKRKVILWSASNEDDKSRFFLKEKLKSFFIKRCDAANVYGKKGKAYFVKLGMEEDKIFVKGNTTGNSFYYDESMRLRTERNSLCERFAVPFHNFLYIGRFSPEKNLFFLLDAYRRLKIEGCDWGLLLVGSGPEVKAIQDYIDRHDIKDVHMPGFKQKQAIPQYLAVSDILILPSISEPWGLVVNEAMAAGMPVLVSRRCGCCPDLIKEGENGFSFDPFDEEELFNIMRDMAEGKHDLAGMGKASLDIIKEYTPQRAAKVIAETVNFALNRKAEVTRV